MKKLRYPMIRIKKILSHNSINKNECLTVTFVKNVFLGDGVSMRNGHAASEPEH